MSRIKSFTAALLVGLVFIGCAADGSSDLSSAEDGEVAPADDGTSEPAGEPTSDDDVEEEQEQDEETGDGDDTTPTTPPSEPPPPPPPPTTGTTPEPSKTCSYGSDVYTPYPGSSVYPIGRVAEHPWRGTSNAYPNGVEDFRNYSSGATIECGGNKSQRDYVDVTAGCLTSSGSGSAASGKVGLTSSGIYRSFALGHSGGDSRPVKWTDQGVEYDFFYKTAATGNVGFKAFTRYTTEYDLYVASWRLDGVVQIQKKHCGNYTVLKRTTSIKPPTPNEWHTMRFEAVGNQLKLYLDGDLAMSVTDNTFTSGTAGIRIDQMKDALIDNWTVFAPN